MGLVDADCHYYQPSWLEVEKATIFLISFCVIAHSAVNKVVIAPRHSVIV